MRQMGEIIDRLKAKGRPITKRNIHLESGILIAKGPRYEDVLRELCQCYQVS
jgi:hypothetical protein